MTGLEVVAAIVGIIAGFSTCSKYAKQIHQQIALKKRSAKALLQMETLQHALNGGEMELEDALDKIRRMNRSSIYRSRG
jgi:hypothetical protein